MNKEQLQKICEAHKKWTLSEGGSGTDLSGTYLRGTDLRGTDLSGAYLRGAYLADDYILTSSNCRYLQLSDYYCWISESKKGLVLKIGCECHLVSEWENYTDKEILEMDGKTALKFWRKEKEILMMVCENMSKLVNHRV